MDVHFAGLSQCRLFVFVMYGFFSFMLAGDLNNYEQVLSPIAIRYNEFQVVANLSLKTQTNKY